MPYAAVERPSIALSLLKVGIEARGLGASVVYGNVSFADAIGIEIYRTISESPPEWLLGEWTFAGAAFPGAPAPPGDFLAPIGDQLEKQSLFRFLARLYPHVDGRRLVTA